MFTIGLLMPLAKDALQQNLDTPTDRFDEMCTSCQDIDLLALFTRIRTIKRGLIREAFYNQERCRLCRYIARHVELAHSHLDIDTEIINANVTYTFRSYREEGDDHGSAKRYYSVAVELTGHPFSPVKFRGFAFTPANILLDPSKQISRQTLIRRAMRSSIDPLQLKMWLDRCTKSHTKCKLAIDIRNSTKEHLAALKGTGQFRLVDVWRNAIVQSDQLQPHIKYFALSYVCGTMTKPSLTTDVLDGQQGLSDHDKRTSIPLRHLPRTIKDAMELVRRLEERYLWVDVLCIDQTNPKELEEVISQMGVIYLNAHATIIAATGKGSEAGFSCLNDDPRRTEQPYSIKTSRVTVELLTPRPSVGTLLKRSTYNTRAWTFQELRLSTRCIFIFDSEVAFSCPKSLHREAYIFHYPGNRKRRAMSPQSRTDFMHPHGDMKLHPFHYDTAVQDYTKRALTKPGDRLDAFLGIYDRFQFETSCQVPKQTLCGFPIEQFVFALLWNLPREATFPSRILQDTRGSRRFPTWSWIAWSCSVTYRVRYDSDKRNDSAEMMQSLAKYNCLEKWKLDVIDECNIKLGKDCDRGADEDEVWPFQPSPCVPTDLAIVTLHIWASLWTSKLVANTSVSSKAGILCEQQVDDVQKIEIHDILGFVYADSTWIEEHAMSDCHLLVLPSVMLGTEALVVRPVDGFLERVPVNVRLFHADALEKRLRDVTYEHLRLR
jgi:hypothetical protein